MLSRIEGERRMSSTEAGEREEGTEAARAASAAAALFDAALDAPLSESRLRAIEQTGVLTPLQVTRAAQLVGGPLPTAVWRSYLQRVLLLAAVGHVVAGIGLLLVEVWEDLGQVGSVALSAAVTVAPAIAAHRVGLASTVGRVLLTASALLCVALVAVAQLAFPVPLDVWFVAALVVVIALPFALAARSGYTWLVPLAALHVSAVMLLEQAGDVDDVGIWLMVSGLGAAAWFGWSALARGVPWMRGRLVPRVEASVAVFAATVVSTRFVASANWFGSVEPVPGTLATTTLVAAAAALTYRAFSARGDLLLAAVSIVSCTLVAAVGVVRLLDEVLGLDTALAFAVAGIGIISATAFAIWSLRKAGQSRGDAS